jgi:hypothetical protein
MADTIRAIATLVSLTAQTSSQVSSLIKEWKDAPAQLQLLADEVESSRKVLQQLKSLTQELKEKNTQTFTAYAEAILEQVERTEPIWIELGKIVESVRGPIGTTLRNERWMKSAPKVSDLQGRLHKIRFNIMELLSSCSMYAGKLSSLILVALLTWV